MPNPPAQEPSAVLELELIQRLHQRDEAALAELYDLHGSAVFGVAMRLLDHSAAQEVAQDVFLRLWEKPQIFDPQRAKLRTFLLVMTRSRALDRCRSTRPTWPLQNEEGVDWPIVDERQQPLELSEAQQRREYLGQVLQTLPAAQRETVERAFLQGQTREEIAIAMQVPVGTVKSRLSYALKHLKQRLHPEVSAWLD